MHPRWVERLAAVFSLDFRRDAEMRWSTTWADLDRVVASPRSVVLIRRDGSLSRFYVSRRKKLSSLMALLLAREVKVDVVDSTVRYALMPNLARTQRPR